MSLIDKVRRCNVRNLQAYIPFIVADEQLGFVTPERAELLGQHHGVFIASDRALSFHPSLGTPEARTAALSALAPTLAESGLFQRPRGEMYAAKNSWHDAPRFLLDRALAVGFGLRAYGVHINGVVRRGDDLNLWIGTRAMNTKVEPGKLDNMVAGGQPHGLTLMANIIKECAEEASLSADIASQARPTGQITYAFDTPQGLRVDHLFCFDLALPTHIVPVNQDGEVASFELMPINEVLHLIAATDRFKFNVNLVIIDFALRHGVLHPDQTPDYDRLISGLHAKPII